MKTLAAAAAAGLLGLLSAMPAGAAPIYRCGQTYTQTPCPGGKVIDSSDPRSAAQRAEARRVVERERQLAARMERERQKQDAAAPPAAATGTDAKAPAASQPVPAKKATKKKKAKADEGNVVVIVPKGQPPRP